MEKRREEKTIQNNKERTREKTLPSTVERERGNEWLSQEGIVGFIVFLLACVDFK